ncbi:MAG: hypothetical protein RL095_904 [Verrucomicrobiota bacterium]|jgi:hypothetical protein
MKLLAALTIGIEIVLSAAEYTSVEPRVSSSQERRERIHQTVSGVKDEDIINDQDRQIDICIAICAKKLGIPETPNKNSLIDTINEANKIVREKSEHAIPVPSQKSLEDAAALDVPEYNIGDEINCIYSPFLQLDLKGRISALGRARFKVDSKEYLIADVMDQKIRDGLQPDRVVLLRQRFIANRLQDIDTLQKKWQSEHWKEIHDALCRANEDAGFISSPEGWVSLAHAVRSEFKTRTEQILAERKRAQEKAAKHAAEEKAKAQNRRFWIWTGGIFGLLIIFGCSLGGFLFIRNSDTPNQGPSVAGKTQSRLRD